VSGMRTAADVRAVLRPPALRSHSRSGPSGLAASAVAEHGVDGVDASSGQADDGRGVFRSLARLRSQSRSVRRTETIRASASSSSAD
jgi:hypothetical protein